MITKYYISNVTTKNRNTMIDLKWQGSALLIKRGNLLIGFIEYKPGTVCRFSSYKDFTEAEALAIWATMRRLNRGQLVEDGDYTGPTLANGLTL